MDDSEAANAVAETARWLADGLGARLLLMHVVEEPMPKAKELLASVRSRLTFADDDDVRLSAGNEAEPMTPYAPGIAPVA